MYNLSKLYKFIEMNLLKYFLKIKSQYIYFLKDGYYKHNKELFWPKLVSIFYFAI